MFRKIITRFIRPRHYWRDIGFDELSELYSSIMFRSLAMSLVGIFIPIYLYQLGYEIWQILFYYSVLFSAMTLANYPVAQLIAKFGPKHSMLASYAFQVMSMLMLVSLADLKWPLFAIAAIQGIGASMYFIAFHVDFSKVKHKEHGGKEVGWIVSMEKIGAVLGPLAGGLVAYYLGKEYIFVVAIALLFIGVIPLFLTSEPTAINQKLKFSELKLEDIKRDVISHAFFNIENVISVIVWPFFIGVYIFSDNPYLQLGSIISFSVFISLFMARIIGKVIDSNQGRFVLRIGTVLNAGIHLFRPFTNGFPYALGVSLANESVTPVYRMPYVKGMYDAADDLPGKRIVYLTAMESSGTIARATLFTVMGVVALLTANSKGVFVAIFIIGAVASLAIMLERFKALESKK